MFEPVIVAVPMFEPVMPPAVGTDATMPPLDDMVKNDVLAGSVGSVIE